MGWNVAFEDLCDKERSASRYAANLAAEQTLPQIREPQPNAVLKMVGLAGLPSLLKESRRHLCFT
jgi:hypothetical protein